MQKLKSMKSRPSLIILCILAIGLGLSSFACSRKTGCPATQNVHTERNGKGKVKGGATTHLFPKKMRKAGR
jgi:hypothetical protein